MFKFLKKIIPVAESAPTAEIASQRLEAMHEELGESVYIDRDSDGEHQIDIYAFERNFIEECDEEAIDDEGFVLVTSGMSDRLMHKPSNFDDSESLATELIWYVRDLNLEYFSRLRWLAKLPFIDETWLGHGHTVPMPGAPLSFCAFKTFLLLPPIIRTDRELFSDIEHQEHTVGTLSVHLVSDKEYASIKTDEGLNVFLDSLDEHGYPKVFDPARASYVE